MASLQGYYTHVYYNIPEEMTYVDPLTTILYPLPSLATNTVRAYCQWSVKRWLPKRLHYLYHSTTTKRPTSRSMCTNLRSGGV